MAQNLITKHIIEAVVKPTLDKGEREKLNADLGRIFADASNIDFNTKETRDSLNNLARAFQAIFDKIGDKSIDFEELIKMPAPDTFAKLGEVAAKQFWDAWESVAKGMGGGVSQDMLKEQFNQLKKQRAELVRQQKALPKRFKEYEKLSSVIEDMPYMKTNEFEAFTKEDIDKMEKELGASIEKIADDMQEALRRATNKLANMSLEDSDYDDALEDAAKKARDVFRMSRTIEKNPSIIKNEEILEGYDFSYLQEDYAEFFEDLSRRFDGIIRKTHEKLESITSQLKGIDDQLMQIQSSGIEIVNQTEAKNGLKTLNEIEEAYKRILTTDKNRPKRADEKKSKKLLDAIEYKPEDENVGIKSLYDKYLSAAGSGDWVEEYKALLKFIRTYDKFSKDGQKHNSMNVSEIQKLFEQTKHMEKNITNMLQSVYNMAHNLPPVGMGGAEDGGSVDSSDDAANAERIAEAKRVAAEKEAEAKKEADAKAEAERKAAEEAERQVKAEKEKAAALKQQRIEEEKIARAAEKKKLADEASAEANRKAAEEAEKERLAKESTAKTEEKVQKLLKNKDAIATMHDTTGEAGAFFNSETGEFSDVIAGGAHSVETERSAWEKAAEAFDVRIHKHNHDVAAPSFSGEINDFNVWIKGFDIFKKQMILANKEILSFDFSSLESVDTLKEIAQKYREGAIAIDAEFDSYFDLAAGGPDKFKTKYNIDGTQKNMNEQLQVELRKVIDKVMENYQGIMTSITLPTDMVKDSSEPKISKEKAEELRRDSIERYANAKARQAQADAQRELNDAEAEGQKLSLEEKYDASSDEVKKKYQELVTLQDQLTEMEANPDSGRGNEQADVLGRLRDVYDELAELDAELYDNFSGADNDTYSNFFEHIRQDALAAKSAVEAVNDVVEETKMLTQQNDSELDDDAEILAKENGQLEDKLELLRDIAEQYGNNITQKQRDRFEELNQKDMNDGLTAKEDERYWELGEQIEEADSALEEFEQTYDRIIVKLANGKKVEILPDDKGLRTLAKIDEEYGESYNGVEIEDVVYERIQKEAAAAEQAVDSLNDSIEETKNVTQSSGGGTGTGDASSAELEAAVTKTETLQDEVEQKNKELADKDAEIARVRAENEAKLKTEADEKDRLQEDLNAKNQQLADVQHENELYDTALTKAEEESNVKDGVIRELREQLANVKTGADEKQQSVSSEELKNVLSSIVYNVKITHDDNDKTANKIAIDEGVLESTLKRVFTNILSPHTEQNDLEPNGEPWALEKTLLSVKEVLDGIHTNTTKAESVEIAPAKTEVGNVLATENTLAAIKTAVESINTKVVKGTKAKTSENSGGKKASVGKKNAESYAGSQYFPEKLKTQTMQLAKFRAQLMTTGKLTDDVDAQIYELLGGLKQVQNGPDFSAWSQKFQQLKTSVGITDIFDKAEDKDVVASYKQLVEFQKERNKLELQYEKAQDGSALKQFYAEQLAQMNGVIAKQEEMLENEEYEAKLAKIREEQARKLGEAEAKATDKVAKKAAADQKKLDKRRAMTGKAGSAIGRAEGVWLEAEGLEQAKLPDGFKKQVSEYYDALDKLRLKHHEINTSEVVTDEQQAELIAQTKEVNRLTEGIGSLVAEYQKLSGSNVDEADSRATTLTGKSGLSEYETTLKQYVRDITNGKGQIKSFNAETKTLTYTVKTGKNEFTEYTAAVRNLDHQLVSVQGTTKRTETFFEATARKMKELTSYFSGMAIFSRIGQELRRGIQYVREIDLALTELKKVTDETEETYDRFLETAAKTADKVGSTIQKVVSSTADWARLGSILAKTNIRPII